MHGDESYITTVVVAAHVAFWLGVFTVWRPKITLRNVAGLSLLLMMSCLVGLMAAIGTIMQPPPATRYPTQDTLQEPSFSCPPLACQQENQQGCHDTCNKPVLDEESSETVLAEVTCTLVTVSEDVPVMSSGCMKGHTVCDQGCHVDSYARLDTSSRFCFGETPTGFSMSLWVWEEWHD